MSEATKQKPTKFIVCVDRSDVSHVALYYTCCRAKRRGAAVDMLHVIAPPDVPTLNIAADKMLEEARSEAEELANRLKEEAASRTGLSPNIVLREGNVGDEIIAQAMEDHDATLLVIGVTPGGSKRGKLVSWLAAELGDKLLIPVMLVPGNLTEHEIDELC